MRSAAGRNDPRLRCLIIGRHRLLVECLHLLLQSQFEVRSVTEGIEEALNLARHFDPQVAIVHWPSSSSAILTLTHRLQEQRPGLAITILSDEDSPGWGPEMPGERFFSTAELVQRLRKRVEAVPTQPADATSQDSLPPSTGIKLSQRELQVLVLLVRGLRMKEVARRLGIAPRTVAFHKYRAMESNGLRTQADLLNFALCHGFLSDEPPERLKPTLAPLLRSAKDTHRGTAPRSR